MAYRHLSRSIVLQSLFECDFSEACEDKDALLSVVLRNAAEFASGVRDTSFMEGLAAGVFEKRPRLDDIIEKAAPDWPIEKIAMVDRNVLRIGLYELLFGDRKEVPPKVAINEAIELAKTFGGESSGRFVNGVLGAVYKELGEPGKDEKSKHAVDKKTLPLDRLVGAVVFSRAEDGEYRLALIHDIFGRWTLTKGHLKDGESEEDGVVRKAREEMGAHVEEILTKLGENEYIANGEDKGKIRKRVSYFLARAAFSDLHPGESGGIDDAKWFKLSDVAHLNIYDDILPIIAKGIKAIPRKDNI